MDAMKVNVFSFDMMCSKINLEIKPFDGKYFYFSLY